MIYARASCSEHFGWARIDHSEKWMVGFDRDHVLNDHIQFDSLLCRINWLFYTGISDIHIDWCDWLINCLTRQMTDYLTDRLPNLLTNWLNTWFSKWQNNYAAQDLKLSRTLLMKTEQASNTVDFIQSCEWLPKKILMYLSSTMIVLHSFTPKMKTTLYFRSTVTTDQTTRCHTPEGSNLRNKLISRKTKIYGVYRLRAGSVHNRRREACCIYLHPCQLPR
jgi:hypothetical protein